MSDDLDGLRVVDDGYGVIVYTCPKCKRKDRRRPINPPPVCCGEDGRHVERMVQESAMPVKQETWRDRPSQL